MFNFLQRPKQKLKDDGTIDFSSKKLGLEHNPKTMNTIDGGATINEISEAILEFRKSFVPEEAVRSAEKTKTKHEPYKQVRRLKKVS